MQQRSRETTPLLYHTTTTANRMSTMQGGQPQQALRGGTRYEPAGNASSAYAPTDMYHHNLQHRNSTGNVNPNLSNNNNMLHSSHFRLDIHNCSHKNNEQYSNTNTTTTVAQEPEIRLDNTAAAGHYHHPLQYMTAQLSRPSGQYNNSNHPSHSRQSSLHHPNGSTNQVNNNYTTASTEEAVDERERAAAMEAALQQPLGYNPRPSSWRPQQAHSGGYMMSGEAPLTDPLPVASSTWNPNGSPYYPTMSQQQQQDLQQEKTMMMMGRNSSAANGSLLLPSQQANVNPNFMASTTSTGMLAGGAVGSATSAASGGDLHQWKSKIQAENQHLQHLTEEENVLQQEELQLKSELLEIMQQHRTIDQEMFQVQRGWSQLYLKDQEERESNLWEKRLQELNGELSVTEQRVNGVVRMRHQDLSSKLMMIKDQRESLSYVEIQKAENDNALSQLQQNFSEIENRRKRALAKCNTFIELEAMREKETRVGIQKIETEAASDELLRYQAFDQTLKMTVGSSTSHYSHDEKMMLSAFQNQQQQQLRQRAPAPRSILVNKTNIGNSNEMLGKNNGQRNIGSGGGVFNSGANAGYLDVNSIPLSMNENSNGSSNMMMEDGLLNDEEMNKSVAVSVYTNTKKRRFEKEQRSTLEEDPLLSEKSFSVAVF